MDNITGKEVVLHTQQLLEDQRISLNLLVREYETGGSLKKVHIGDWDIIDSYPCITIEPGVENFAYGATDFTGTSTYNFVIRCYIKNVAREETVLYIMDFASSVFHSLNNPLDTAWTSVDNAGIIWNSTASDITYGFKKGAALRMATINYKTDLWNPIYTK
jgi:hypothetical protein